MTMPATSTAHHDDYPTRLPHEEWLERKDPTVWGKWSPEAPLTRAETQSFEKNGYLVLKGVFSAAEIEALQEKIAAKLGFELLGHKLELYGVPIRKKG